MADRGHHDPNSPRAVASYLVQLRPVLAEATHARQAWVRRIGVMMEDVRHGEPRTVIQSAGRIGREQITIFREAQRNLERLSPPSSCVACQRTLTCWIEKLIASCEVMIDVGNSGDLKRIRETQSLLAEGRGHARQFNTEYARLVADLRQRIELASSGRQRPSIERRSSHLAAGPRRAR